MTARIFTVDRIPNAPAIDWDLVVLIIAIAALVVAMLMVTYMAVTATRAKRARRKAAPRARVRLDPPPGPVESPEFQAWLNQRVNGDPS